MRYSGMKLIFCLLLGMIAASPGLLWGKTKVPLPVYVSILPQAYFVERIGGERVSVNVLVLPGKSPATYTPTPSQMSKLAKSTIFFRIGVPFENVLIPKIKNSAKRINIIDTRTGIQLRKMVSRHGGHSHTSGNDPHTWMNPLNVKKQALVIYHALAAYDPEGKLEYQANYNAFINDLDSLHKKLKEVLAPMEGSTIFVFHPSFGYFTDAYGLTQTAVEIEGKAPKAKDLSVFIKRAKQKNIRIIFVQPQFNRHAAQKIAAAIDGVVVSLNPLSRDYIDNLEKMAATIADKLKK